MNEKTNTIDKEEKQKFTPYTEEIRGGMKGEQRAWHKRETEERW